MSISITSFNLHNSMDSLVIKEISSELALLRNYDFNNLDIKIDKCWIRSNHLKLSSLESFKKENPRSSKYYSKRIIYRHSSNPHFVIQIFKDLKRSKSDYKHKIELNPSYIGNYADFVSLLKSLLGPKGIQNHHISRVDISFKFHSQKISVDSFFYAIYFKYKHSLNKYKRHSEIDEDTKKLPDFNLCNGYIESISIGESPLRLTVYDQSFKRKNPQEIINFEVQISKHKVESLLKIKRIQDFHNLLIINPLKLISFKDVTCTKRYIKTRPSVTNRLILTGIKTHQLGFHMARAMIKRTDPNFDNIIMSKLGDLKHQSNKKSFKGNLLTNYRIQMEKYLKDHL